MQPEEGEPGETGSELGAVAGAHVGVGGVPSRKVRDADELVDLGRWQEGTGSGQEGEPGETGSGLGAVAGAHVGVGGVPFRKVRDADELVDLGRWQEGRG
jgi:hypothetical protein